MSDETHAESPAAPAQAEMKSIDTLNKPIEVTEEVAIPEQESSVSEAEEASDDLSEEENDAPDAGLSEEQKAKRRKSRHFKERLEKVRAEAKAEAYQEALKALGKAEQPEPVQQQPPQSNDKSLEDFDFDVGAYAEYKANRAIEKRDEESRRASAETAFKSRVESLTTAMGEGAWDEIVTSPINQDPKYKAVTDIFMESDKGLEIAHHLATNPDEAERIVSLPKHRMVVELGKLISRFEGETAPTPPPVKKVSKAPPPPQTINGAGKGKVDLYAHEQSTADRIRAWKTK